MTASISRDAGIATLLLALGCTGDIGGPLSTGPVGAHGSGTGDGQSASASGSGSGETAGRAAARGELQRVRRRAQVQSQGSTWREITSSTRA